MSCYLLFYRTLPNDCEHKLCNYSSRDLVYRHCVQTFTSQVLKSLLQYVIFSQCSVFNQSANYMFNVSVADSIPEQLQQVQCSDNFFTDNNITCKPECSSFTSLPKATATAIQITGVIVTCVGLLSSAAVLVLAAIQYKKM